MTGMIGGILVKTWILRYIIIFQSRNSGQSYSNIGNIFLTLLHEKGEDTLKMCL